MTTRLGPRKLLIALTSAAVVAGLAGCDASITAHQTTSSTAGATSACVTLGGTVDAKQNCHVESATAAYKIDMSVPLDYPDPQTVTDFLRQDRDQFVSWVA